MDQIEHKPVETLRPPDEILDQVRKGLDAQFSIYTWEDMINDLDLNEREKEWAKDNITYTAVYLYQKLVSQIRVPEMPAEDPADDVCVYSLDE